MSEDHTLIEAHALGDKPTGTVALILVRQEGGDNASIFTATLRPVQALDLAQRLTRVAFLVKKGDNE